MRTARLIALVLFVLMVGWLVWLWYPVAAPIIHHQAGYTWLNAFWSIGQQPGRSMEGPAGFVLLGLGILLVVDVGIYARLTKSHTHGSARRATRHDVRPFRQPWTSRFTAPTRSPGVVAAYQGRSGRDEQRLLLGRYQGGAISLSQVQQQQNVLLTAQIGAGKTSRVIIRNLLRETGKRSLFISDVKGELVRRCAGYLTRSYDVKVFAPTRSDLSDGYNPLAYVQNQDDAFELADCWIANTGTSKNDDFWMKQSRRLMVAAILHIRTTEPNAPFYRLADVLCGMTYDEMKHLLTSSRHPYARSEARVAFDAMDKNERLQGSVMADLGTRFQLLLSDAIKVTTARNDIDLGAMGERSMAVFLSIPPRAAERCHPIMALFMMHAFNAWEARAERALGGELPVKVQCYLDEFANLGYIYDVSGHLTTMRGAGIGMLIVLQSFAQVDERYGVPVRKTLLTNCGTHLLLPGAGLEECEYYSSRIGDATVATSSITTNGSGWAATRTYNQGEMRRRLFTPDELRTMQPDQMLVLGSATQAMVVETLPYFRDRAVAGLVDLPFAHTVIYQTQAQVTPSPSSNSQTVPPPQLAGLPSAPSGTVVDADLDDDDFMPKYQP